MIHVTFNTDFPMLIRPSTMLHESNFQMMHYLNQYFEVPFKQNLLHTLSVTCLPPVVGEKNSNYTFNYYDMIRYD